MQSAKPTTSKIINDLCIKLFAVSGVIFGLVTTGFAQDNSPYSRYGIGDLIPSSNVSNRGMGGLSAAYSDPLSVNFNNPASFSSFQAWKEKKSKKLSSGRAVLDVALNVDNRTLRDPGVTQSFKASNALFSYVQIGVPLRKNWGMSFGLRPISRISYKIDRFERLYDPVSGASIDSAITKFQGDGGAYLGSLGTGLALFSKDRGGLEEKLSVGVTLGYLFGKKDYSTLRSLLNDTVAYYQAKYQTTTTYGNVQLSGGLQYQKPIGKKMMLTLGAFGHLGQSLNARQDKLLETFYYDQTRGEVRLDSVSDLRDVRGKLQMPASYTFGFTWQKFAVPNKEGGWMVGADYSQQAWSEYRFYNKVDSLQDKWELRLGAQFSPVPSRNYFTNVSYRVGFFTGPDYVRLGKALPQTGASLGLGLPVGISRQAPNQVTFVNMAFEYIKRGNKSNVLRENLFRVSLGFSLSDIWFIKRQYD